MNYFFHLLFRSWINIYYSFPTYVDKTCIFLSSDSLPYMHSQNCIEQVLSEDEKSFEMKEKKGNGF